MPKYNVKIKATIIKTVENVEADNAAHAEELAHETFNIMSDGTPENYDQETVEVTKSTMDNLAMQRKLDKSQVVDVAKFADKDTEGVYKLPDYAEGMDYCDALTEEWIRSIGKHLETGEILAAIDTRFYQNKEYECLWLR